VNGFPQIFEGLAQIVPLLIDHILTALAQCFGPVVYVVRDLVGFAAGLLQCIFRGFGRLLVLIVESVLAQVIAFLLDLGAHLFPRLRRQQQHSPCAGQSPYEQTGHKTFKLIDSALACTSVHTIFSYGYD